MRVTVACLTCLALASCNSLTVREATLSNSQEVAMVSTPGDGVSPPTNLVLMKDARGRFVPISTGYAQAPVTALLAGALAGAAVGGGMAGAAALRRPDSTGVSVTALGGSGGTGGIATGIGGTAIGGTAIGGGATAFGGSATAF